LAKKSPLIYLLQQSPPTLIIEFQPSCLSPIFPFLKRADIWGYPISKVTPERRILIHKGIFEEADSLFFKENLISFHYLRAALKIIAVYKANEAG